MPHSTALKLLLVSVLVAGVASPGVRASTAAPVRANDTLSEAMDQMNAVVKELGKGINAGNQAASLELFTKFETALLTAKAQVPDTAAGVDEKKRPDFVAEFRSTLCEALKLACDAEIATANGKFKDAENIVKGKLGALKSAGHSKFKRDVEGKGGK